MLSRVGVEAHAGLQGRAIALYTTMDPACPQHLRGNGPQMEALLNHLVRHSLKHTLQGSVTVDVKVRQIHNDTVTLRWSVVDTRPGLALEPTAHAAAGASMASMLPLRESAMAGDEAELNHATQLLELHNTCPRMAWLPGGSAATWFDLTLPVERRARPGALPAHTAVFSNNRRFIDTVATQWAARALGLLPRDAHAQAQLWVVDSDFPLAAPVLERAQREGRQALCVSALPPPAGSQALALAHAAPAALARHVHGLATAN